MTTFEIHLTVTGLPKDVDEFARVNRGSVLRLELDNAVAAVTNVTWDIRGTLSEAKELVDSLGEQSECHGIEVVSVKIEAPMSEFEIQADAMPPYYELHTRVSIPPSQLAQVDRLIRTCGARLSRQARTKVNGEGTHDRYVNLRVAAFADAKIAFTEVIALLEAAKIPIVKVHREQVLIDTNRNLDDNWLPVVQSPGAIR